MISELEPRNEIDLIQQVGEWADRNFYDKRWAEIGCVEEIGEGCHCVLKQFQGIRGFADKDKFTEKFSDALADIIIYLCDWCYVHQAFFKFGRNHEHISAIKPEDERRVIVHILQAAAAMMTFPVVRPGQDVPIGESGAYNMAAQRLATGVECWAQIYELDIRLIVSKAWADVRKRNWVADPAGAGGVSAQAEAREFKLPEPPAGMHWVRRSDRPGEWQLANN
jgi:hypothetical protein